MGVSLEFENKLLLSSFHSQKSLAGCAFLNRNG